MNSDTAYRGGCLCGTIRYQVSAFEPRIAHCHCTMCQRFHGAAFSTFGEVRLEHFKWDQGEEALQSYQAENGTVRQFCSHCGSSLRFLSPYNLEDETVEVAIATLDDPQSLQVDAHIYTATQVPWIKLCDGLPQHLGYRPDDEQ